MSGSASTALVPPAALNQYRAWFVDELMKQPEDFMKLCRVFETTKRNEIFTVPGYLGSPRLWQGQRQIDRIKSYELSYDHEKYEHTIAFDVDEIADDPFGLDEHVVRQMAVEMARFPEELLVQLLLDGFTTTNGLDGQLFFDTDHESRDSGTQSNKGTAALEADGVALIAAITAMKKLKNDRGKPLGVYPTHLMYGPDSSEVVKELLNSERILIALAGNSDDSLIRRDANTLKDVLIPWETPYITDDKWFMFDLSKGGVKPLVWLWRQKPEFAVDETDRFKEDVIYKGTKARHGRGYGFWQTAFGATP